MSTGSRRPRSLRLDRFFGPARASHDSPQWIGLGAWNKLLAVSAILLVARIAHAQAQEL